MTAGNPFLQNIFETKDGRFVVLSAVYVDLAYQWTALLGCSVQIDDVRAAVKRWNSYGQSLPPYSIDPYTRQKDTWDTFSPFFITSVVLNTPTIS
jgi:hypothetical protein